MSKQDDKLQALIERAASLAHEPWQQLAHSASVGAERAIRYDVRAQEAEHEASRESHARHSRDVLRDAVTFAIAAYLAAEEADQ